MSGKTTAAQPKEEKPFKLPHVFVLLTSIALLVALLTYVIPAGVYERVVDPVSGRSVVDPNSFHYVEQAPIAPMQFLMAFTSAFNNAASMIFMTLVVGGAFGIINRLGIIPAIISMALGKFQKRKALAIPVLVLAFSLFDSFMGAPELCIVFLPIILPLVLSLGWDTVTACAIVICGNCVGYSTGMGNPFTTIIAQKICELPLYSGMGFRGVCFVLFNIATILYIMWYAKKISDNPRLSKTYEADLKKRETMELGEGVRLDTRTKLAGVFALICFVSNIVGVIRFGWDLPQMTGIFLVMSVGCGVIAGNTLSRTCLLFMEGARDILQGALVMCVARTITIVMTESNTMDLMVHSLAKIAAAFPPVVAAVGIFVVAMLINFFIPSGSGEASVLMPILSPLSELLGVSKQVTVVAFQFGDGWSNTIFPTNASYMSTLAVGGLNWTDWLSFQIPLCGIWTVMSAVLCFIAQLINLGPF